MKYPYKCLNVLGNKLRIDIIKLLSKKKYSVKELCKQTKKEQSVVSHALQQLRKCNFIDFEIFGKERKYFLKSDIFNKKNKPLLDLIEDHVKKYCGEKK